jgi:hypothetical protein
MPPHSKPQLQPDLSKKQSELDSQQANLDSETREQGGKLGSLAAKFVYMGLERFREDMEQELGRAVTLEESATVLDTIIDQFSFAELDALIGRDWKVMFVINSAMRLAGAVLSAHDGWKEELLTGRETILLEMARLYRKDIYDIFVTRPALLKFFTEYIIYKFRLR